MFSRHGMPGFHIRCSILVGMERIESISIVYYHEGKSITGI